MKKLTGETVIYSFSKNHLPTCRVPSGQRLKLVHMIALKIKFYQKKQK